MFKPEPSHWCDYTKRELHHYPCACYKQKTSTKLREHFFGELSSSRFDDGGCHTRIRGLLQWL